MTDALFALGVALIVAGVGTWNYHAGLVLAGLALAAVAWERATGESRKRKRGAA